MLRVMWAEDATIFLRQAIDTSCGSWMSPYAGYMHVAPRAVACIGSLVSLPDAAAVMATATAAVQAGVLLAVFRAARGQLPGVAHRVALLTLWAASPVLAGEVLDVTCNIQWVLLPAAFWLLLWRDRRLGTAIGAVLAFVAAGSSAVALLLLPLAAVRLAVVSTWRDRILPLAFALGAVLQLDVIAGTSRVAPIGSPTADALAHSWIYRVTMSGVLGPTWTDRAVRSHPTLLSFLVVGAVVVVLSTALACHARRMFAVVSLIAAVGVGTATLVRAWSPVVAYFGPGTPFVIDDRYFVFPVLTLIGPALTAVPSWSTLRRRTRLWPTAVALAGLAVACTLGMTTDFQLGQKRRQGVPSWSHEVAAARVTCRAGRTAATAQLAPAGWFATWPCSDFSKVGAA
jgi:hypothetical protein